MSNTYRGTPLMLQQRSAIIFSPQSGYVNELEYRGMSYSRALILANAWANAGAQYSLTNQQGISVLVVQDSTGTYTLDVWEIGVNQVLNKSVFNPRNIVNVPAGNLELIARAERDNCTLDEAAASLEEDTGDIYDPVLTNAYAIRLWKRIQLGQDSYWEDQYVVRHTTNVSNRYPYNIADTGKNCIYSPGQFYSEAQSILLWILPMPNAFVNVLTSNGTPATIPDNYSWGYIKSGSPRVTIANNRSQIITEYRQGLWPNDEYAFA